MSFTANFIKTVRPLREFVVGFAVTGYLIMSIPISDETKETSKYLNPHKAHGDH
eukprot:m.30475 g.30475  ORF g.30475 m.30475 type:complete len:54 (+) comp9282_c0_seq1:306-467(+)